MNLKNNLKQNKIFSLKYVFYDIVKWTGALSAFIFLRPCVKYTDKKAVKALKNGVIISSNHVGYLDPVILHCAFPLRRLHFIAVDELFNTPAKNWFFTHVNCIKLNKSNTAADTIRAAGEVLKDGKALCIFPEGQISRTDSTADFRPGCALMSVINNVPILPVYVKKRKSILRCTRIAVGEPVYPESVPGSNRSIAHIEMLNKYLYEKEAELCLSCERK